jgi:surface antigen
LVVDCIAYPKALYWGSRNERQRLFGIRGQSQLLRRRDNGQRNEEIGMSRRWRRVGAIVGICGALALLVSGWAALRPGGAQAAALGPRADASCATLARVDWTATNGPQWGRTLLAGHSAHNGWFGVDVCGNGINAYAPGGTNLSCDRVPANFGATGCAPGGATYDGFGLTFQCVELVARFSAWAFADRPSAWHGNAPDLWLSGNHPVDFTAIPNGSRQPPAPGDVVVWGAVDAHGHPWPAGPHGEHNGHVAVVAKVNGGNVMIVEENALWGTTNVPSETLPLTHAGAGWHLGKSRVPYGWLHSSKNTGRFDGNGAVRGAPHAGANQSSSSSTGMPALTSGVVVAAAGTLADLAWSTSATAGVTTDDAAPAPHAAARSLGAPPSVRLALTQTPATLATPTGGRDAYVVGQNGQLYVARTAPTQLGVMWQALGAPPGVTLIGSVAASILPGGTAVGAVGSDGGLWWRAGPAGNLGGWMAIGHPAQALLAGPVIMAGAPATGLPLALALGTDGHLYESDWITAATDGSTTAPGAAASSGWSSWAPVALSAQVGLVRGRILPITELPTANARIGAWSDTPLDVVILGADGVPWLLRRSGGGLAWRTYQITGAAGVTALLAAVAVPLAPDATQPSAALLHVYTAGARGTALVSVRVDPSGRMGKPTWNVIAPSPQIEPAALSANAVALGPDLSVLAAASGQRIALAGEPSALALVAPTSAAASPSAVAPAPAWVAVGAVAGPDVFTDTFQAPALDSRWLLVGAADAARAERGGGVALAPAPAPGRTMLLQGAPAGDLQITGRVALPAAAPASTQAGLLLYLDDGNWLALGVSRSGAAAFCPVAWDHAMPCQTLALPRAFSVSQGVYLRFERYGNIFSGLVSADGTNWRLVGAWRPSWSDAHPAGTPTPSPSPTATSGFSGAPSFPPDQDAAPLAFTSAGMYSDGPGSAAATASASGWPLFLSFDVAVPGAPGGVGT